MKKIRVVQYGLGAMGSKMAEFVLKKEELELVAVIVRSEDKIGRVRRAKMTDTIRTD